MVLPELAFPLEELSWDKFTEVQTSIGLEPMDTLKVMKLVLGDDPPAVPCMSITRYLLFLVDHPCAVDSPEPSQGPLLYIKR